MHPEYVYDVTDSADFDNDAVFIISHGRLIELVFNSY